ncbi:acyl carrier protein [Sediminicola arcticus]|jgi:acyl carrier protein|uniref:Acyl carrier protein n=1 Tax=Sediminicola arcticus TaxID=1574308 RepID=A0ABV2SV33_9FLAO
MNEHLEKLTLIFRDVLENNTIVLNEDTIAQDIDEWDSLNHIYLVVEIERQLNVKFTTQEISEWKNIGDILKAIKKHSNS